MKPLILDFTAPKGDYRLTFEDDLKVAYAYLKMADKIVGDVWLYNRELTPDQPEWGDKGNSPFRNSRQYVDETGTLQKDVAGDDVLVQWDYEGDRPIAYVYVFEDLYGVIGVGDKPGYARHAAKSGPLAKVMEVEDV